MNRIDQLFKTKKDILNIYFTAGYPGKDDTVKILKQLEASGVDMVEVGMPYSDPLADGMTIQESSKVALGNGMHMDLMFEQVREARQMVSIPMVIMGYFNQFLQYGMERSIDRMVDAGIDGVIIPDLPMEYYEDNYKDLFEEKNVAISFLVTPETSEERIRKAADLSSSFLYVVARSSITGKTSEISEAQKVYFEKIQSLHLSSPTLIGFGIHDKDTFQTACQYANGAIVGSAFIRHLTQHGTKEIESFVRDIKES